MIQNYKLFYKSNTIEFINLKLFNKNNFAHVLLEPDINQIFTAFDSCLTNDLKTMDIIILSDNPDRIFEDFYKKINVIEAAGGVVKNNENKYLLIKRNNVWDLPKGKIGEEENAETAALREIAEETGLSDLKIEKEIDTTYHIYKLNETWILKKTYWFLLLTGSKSNLVPQIEEGITEVCWCESHMAEELMKKSYASLQHILEKAIIQISSDSQ